MILSRVVGQLKKPRWPEIEGIRIRLPCIGFLPTYVLKALRDDVRFQALVRQAKLPQGAGATVP